MARTRFFRLMAGASALVLAATPVLAQPGEDDDSRGFARLSDDSATTEKALGGGWFFSLRLDVEFPGGTAAEYVELLRSGVGVDNILVQGPLDEFRMPAVDLTGVTYQEALQLIAKAEEPEEFHSGNIEVEIDRSIATIKGVVNRHGPFGDNDKDDGELETLVYSFATDEEEALAEPLLFEIVEAAEAAASFIDDPGLDIRVHEPTGALFVRGRDASLEIVDRTIDRMRERAERRAVARETREAGGAAAEELEAELREAREAWAEAMERIEGLESELDEARDAAVEAELETRRAVVEATLDLEIENARLEARADEAVSTADSLRQRVDDLVSEAAHREAELARLRAENERLRAELERPRGPGG